MNYINSCPNYLFQVKLELIDTKSSFLKADAHFAPKKTLLLRRTLLLKSKTHLEKSQFTPQHTLLLNTLSHSESFTPHYTLLLNTLCHSEPFTLHYTLLFNTLCLSEHLAHQNTMLCNTFCSP